MNKRIYILLLSFIMLICINETKAQQHCWVYFKNKPDIQNQIQHPELYLSELAIERRALQNIAIQETDIPVNPIYVQTIKTLCDEVRTSSKWFNAVSITISSSLQLEQIKALPFVSHISKVNTYSLTGSRSLYENKFEPIVSVDVPLFSPTPYGSAYRQIQMIGIDSLHALGYTGKGKHIAVFDGGFLRVNQLDFFEKARNENRIKAIWNYVESNTNVYARSNHGTAVMSVMCADIPNTMIGAAPDASYYLFITEDVSREYRIEEDNWVAAAEKADSIGVDIFNTSLGYTLFDDTTENHTYAEINGDSTIITKAANIAASKGILVVNSAGNEGNSAWRYISAPADGDSVLCVGAVNANREIAGFSSRGPNSSGHLKPNVCAHGAGVIVATLNNSTLAQSNGTSFSGPIIAASAACLWQAFPDKSSSQIFHSIEKSAHLYPSSNYDYGFGIPSFYNAYKSFQTEIYNSNPQLTIPKIYPNPFRNIINILWKSASNAPLSIELLNSNGEVISNAEYSPQADMYTKYFIQLLDEKDAGVYIIRLKQNNYNYTTTLIKY